MSPFRTQPAWSHPILLAALALSLVAPAAAQAPYGGGPMAGYGARPPAGYAAPQMAPGYRPAAYPGMQPAAHGAYPGAAPQAAYPQAVYPQQGMLYFANGALTARRQPEAPESEQPPEPEEATTEQEQSPFGDQDQTDFTTTSFADTAESGRSDPFGGDLTTGVEAASDRALGGSGGSDPASDVVFGGPQVVTRSTSDAGTLVHESPTATGVSLFQRSAATDPHIRGFRNTQIYSQLDGGWWRPARQDLDTIVSKADSGIVDDIIIIKGPYSALYGPSFSFFDVVTRDTPRYCCGHGFGGMLSANWDENGDGFYSRQMVEGGGSFWGYRISSGIRTHGDYESGDGTPIRASYKHRDLDVALGYDLSCRDRIEVNYIRLDLTDAEFYNQPTDIGFQVSNGLTARWERLCPCCNFDHLVVEGWYNRTRIGFDPVNPLGALNDIVAMQDGQVVTVATNRFLVDTYADQISTGYRTGLTRGDKNASHITLGLDLRHLQQELLETGEFTQLNVIGNFDGLMPGEPFEPVVATTDIPDSRSVNPGFFFQGAGWIDCRTRLTYGGRFDFVHTDVSEPRPVDMTQDAMLNPTTQQLINGSEFVPLRDRDFDLWAVFATFEYDISPVWTLTVGGGHAERAPTLTELYAMDPFIAANQQGFNALRGNTLLEEERLWQVDAGVRAQWCNARLQARGFYGWIDNYITTAFQNIKINQALQPGVPPGNVTADSQFRGFQFVNTDEATLAGAEFSGQYDLTCWLTMFGNVAYVDGRDQEINQPLYQIYPLSSRVGGRVRVGDTVARGAGWELSARIVAEQDRVGARTAGVQPVTGVPERPTPGFTIWDLRAYWRLSPNFLFTYGVENLFDKNYFEHYDYRDRFEGTLSFQPGRNYYLGGQYTF